MLFDYIYQSAWPIWYAWSSSGRPAMSPTSFTPPANTVPASVQRGKQFPQPWTAFSMPSKVSAVPSCTYL